MSEDGYVIRGVPMLTLQMQAAALIDGAEPLVHVGDEPHERRGTAALVAAQAVLLRLQTEMTEPVGADRADLLFFAALGDLVGWGLCMLDAPRRAAMLNHIVARALDAAQEGDAAFVRSDTGQVGHA